MGFRGSRNLVAGGKHRVEHSIRAGLGNFTLVQLKANS